MDRKKDRKPDPTGPIWTGLRLRLPPLFGWMNQLNRLQPPQDTPSKYLQNTPKNIENDQDLTELLNCNYLHIFKFSTTFLRVMTECSINRFGPTSLFLYDYVIIKNSHDLITDLDLNDLAT